MSAATLLCLVVAITDGDTLKARCGERGAYEQVAVRLAEIDAPERKQPFGQKSRQKLADLCFKTMATLRVTGKDRYGRAIARVECEGIDANLALVRFGLAWAYTKYQTDPAFTVAEEVARERRVGLWIDLGSANPPVAPWEWRRRKR